MFWCVLFTPNLASIRISKDLKIEGFEIHRKHTSIFNEQKSTGFQYFMMDFNTVKLSIYHAFTNLTREKPETTKSFQQRKLRDFSSPLVFFLIGSAPVGYSFKKDERRPGSDWKMATTHSDSQKTAYLNTGAMF